MTESQDNSRAPDNNEELNSRIKDLEKKIESTEKSRRTSTIINLVGAIIIVITLVIFIWSLVSFANNYNNKALFANIKKDAPQLANSKEAKKIYKTIKSDFLPAYKNALAEEFSAKAPELEEQTMKEKEELYSHIENKVAPKILNNLLDSIKKAQLAALDKDIQNKVTPEKVRKTAEFTQKQLSKNLKKKIKADLGKVRDITLASNNYEEIYEKMKSENEFKGLNRQDIKDRLIESVLKLLIYKRLNPEEGNKPAYSGGAK